MRRRTVPVVSAVAILLVGVTGCSASGASADDCSTGLEPGALSSSVKVQGAEGSAPQVTIPDDVSAEQSQRSIVSSTVDADDRDDETAATDGTLVAVNLALYSDTGEELMSSQAWDSDRGSSFVLIDPEAENPLATALRCAVAGDRVVAAFDADDSALLAGTGGGIEPGASIVGVVDVVAVDPMTASGKQKNLPSGFPAVVTDDTGRPGVVLPPRPAPDGTRSADRIVGDGEEVQADDAVIAQVLAVGWDGTVDPQNNSWDTAGGGGPIPLGTEDDIAASGATYRAELTGRTVGSQVVIVEGGETARVVVVDIVSIG